MGVAETSKAAYQSIKPQLKGKRLDVYLAIKQLGEASNRDIARHLNWEINRVTGRVSELVELNWIVYSHRQKASTGKTEQVWRLTELKQSSFIPEMDCAV